MFNLVEEQLNIVIGQHSPGNGWSLFRAASGQWVARAELNQGMSGTRVDGSSGMGTDSEMDEERERSKG